MKAIVFLACFGMVGTCLGQGTLLWSFLPPPFISTQTNSTQYSPFYCGYPAPTGYGSVGNTAPNGSGLGYYYELLYTSYNGSQAAIPSLAALLSWQDTGLTATNSGLFLGGRLRPVNPNPTAPVPWAAGVTNNIVLVGWSANLGASWAVVSNELANWDGSFSEQAFFGVSATGYLTPNINNGLPGASVFGVSATPNGLPIYSPNTQLYLLPTAIPEPGTSAVAGLGGLSLLLFYSRRKKGS